MEYFASGGAFDALEDFAAGGVFPPTYVSGEPYALEDAVAAILEALSAFDLEAARLRPLLEVEAYSDHDLGNHCAEMILAVASSRAARAVLDPAQSETFSVFTDGGTVIRLWQWERANRAALIDLERAARESCEAADELRRGRGRVVYLTRDGDTLQSIAARFLGDHRSYRAILDLNPTIVAGPIAPGTRLELPDPGR